MLPLLGGAQGQDARDEGSRPIREEVRLAVDGEGEGSGRTLRHAQAEVDATIQALGGYWPPLANLARLVEECGELARAVNQSYGPKQVKTSEAPASMVEELGDCLYVLLALANSVQVDAESALTAALEKAHRRAAPARPDARARGE